MVFKTVILICALCVANGCTPRDDKHHVVTSAEHRSTQSTSSKHTAVRHLLERALNAQGGNSALEKLKRCKITYRSRNEIPIPATRERAASRFSSETITEDYFEYPDKIRRAVTKAMDRNPSIIYVLNGQNTWVHDLEKRTVERWSNSLGPDAAWPPEFQRFFEMRRWLESNGSGLALGGPETLDGHPCDCVAVVSSDKVIGRVYLDQATHLARKVTKLAPPDLSQLPESLRQSKVIEVTTTEYKRFDGVVLPTKTVVMQGGRKLSETTLLKIEFLKAIDAKLFQKPDKEQTTDGTDQHG